MTTRRRRKAVPLQISGFRWTILLPDEHQDGIEVDSRGVNRHNLASNENTCHQVSRLASVISRRRVCRSRAPDQGTTEAAGSHRGNDPHRRRGGTPRRRQTTATWCAIGDTGKPDSVLRCRHGESRAVPSAIGSHPRYQRNARRTTRTNPPALRIHHRRSTPSARSRETPEVPQADRPQRLEPMSPTVAPPSDRTLPRIECPSCHVLGAVKTRVRHGRSFYYCPNCDHSWDDLADAPTVDSAS
jgi:hypothetical protein